LLVIELLGSGIKTPGAVLHAHEGECMLWTLFAVLLILWLVGFGLNIAGSMVHVLLFIALGLLIVNLVARGTII
jgi:hypothetical protein